MDKITFSVWNFITTNVVCVLRMRCLSNSIKLCLCSLQWQSKTERGKIVIIQEVIFLRVKDKSTSIKRLNDERDLSKWSNICESTRGFSGQGRGRGGGRQWYPACLCLSQKTALLSLCHSKDISSWHRREWGEAALVSVRHWDRITQPPVDEKWGEKQRLPLFYCLLGGGGVGCLTWHIPQKQESEGGLCTALTPNGVNDNPVIIARDSGKLLWEMRSAIHRQPWPESLLNGKQYHSLSWLKSYTFSISVAS